MVWRFRSRPGPGLYDVNLETPARVVEPGGGAIVDGALNQHLSNGIVDIFYGGHGLAALLQLRGKLICIVVIDLGIGNLRGGAKTEIEKTREVELLLRAGAGRRLRSGPRRRSGV